MAFAGTLNKSQNVYGNNNLSDGDVVTDSFTQSPSCFSDRPVNVRPRSPSEQDSYNSSRKASIGSQSSSAATSNNYKRWCFVCENPGAIITPDGFKRHMREHHTAFYCIPQNSTRNTESGPICAFCGFSNPDPSHLNKHNVPKCVGKTYTRKENLTDHLAKKHGICHGSALADQSRHTVNQKYFACGFCVFCCDSLNGLVKHVDGRHYRFLEDIRDWDDANAIRGILSQPAVNGYWRGVLAAIPHLREWCLTWKPTDAKELRHRLEMGQEPTAALVQAVMEKSNYCTSQLDHIRLARVTGSADKDMDTSHSTQTSQREDRLSALASTPEQGFVSHASPMTALTLQSQRLVRDPAGFNDSGCDTNYEGRPSTQIASETNGSPANKFYSLANHRAVPYSSQKGDEGYLQRQRPAYVPWNASASSYSQAMESQARTSHYPMLGGYSPGVSRDFAPHPGSRQVIETHPCPAQAYVDSYPPTWTNQPASSSLSPNHETSPLSHLNRAYSPHYPTVPAHCSRQATGDRPGMDIDLEPDYQQRFIQDQNGSQRQRRRR